MMRNFEVKSDNLHVMRNTRGRSASFKSTYLPLQQCSLYRAKRLKLSSIIYSSWNFLSLKCECKCTLYRQMYEQQEAYNFVFCIQLYWW